MLRTLITAFITGDDTSLTQANKIEAMLDDTYPEDDFVQQTIEMLAMYRPEGGDYLFDTDAIKQRLKNTMDYLK